VLSEQISLANGAKSTLQAGGTGWYFSFHLLCQSWSLFGLNASQSCLEISPNTIFSLFGQGLNCSTETLCTQGQLLICSRCLH
jgi:hypothetical protein